MGEEAKEIEEVEVKPERRQQWMGVGQAGRDLDSVQGGFSS